MATIGETVTNGTAGSVLFVGAGPVLAQDNNGFYFDASTNTLRTANAAGGSASESFAVSTGVGGSSGTPGGSASNSGTVTINTGSGGSGSNGANSGPSGNVLLKTGSGGANASSSGGAAGHIILQPGNGGSGTTQGPGGSTLIRASNSGDILAVQNSAGSTTHLRVANNGNTGVGVSTPTARLHLGAGTSTLAPLKFTASTNLTSPEAGAMEWDGSQLHITQTTGPKRRPMGFGDTPGASSPANHYSTGEFSWNNSSAFGGAAISGSMTHGLAIADPRTVFRPEDYGGVYNVATIAQAQVNSTVIENIKAAMPDTGGIIELRDEFFTYGTVGNLRRPYINQAISNVTNNGSGLIRIVATEDHGLVEGDRITVSGVGGVTNANGEWIVNFVSSTTFDLVGSTFAGTYTSGGTFALHRPIPFGIVGCTPGRSALINLASSVPAIEWIGRYAPWVPSGVPLFTLRDLVVISQGPGIRISPSGGAGQLQFSNVEAARCKGYGWSFEQMYGASMWNCRAFFNQNEGFKFVDSVIWPSVVESMWNGGPGVYALRADLKGLYHAENNESWGIDFDAVTGDLAIWQEGNHYGTTNYQAKIQSRLRSCAHELRISGQTQDRLDSGFDMDDVSKATTVIHRVEVEPSRLVTLEPYDLALPAMGDNATVDVSKWTSGFRPSIVRDGDTLHIDVAAGTYNHVDIPNYSNVELFPSDLALNQAYPFGLLFCGA